MSDHHPSRRIQRQRERKQRHAQEAALRAAYNRDGLSAVVAALGGGEAEHWVQDSPEDAKAALKREQGR